MTGKSSQPLKEVLFEFVPMGTSIKVSAIDPVSGTEVSIVGPASSSQRDLERVARSKLQYVMSKKAGETR